MNEQIGPKVKHVWNSALQVLHNFLRFVINATAYPLGRYRLHLLHLKSSVGMVFVYEERVIQFVRLNDPTSQVKKMILWTIIVGTSELRAIKNGKTGQVKN